MLKAVIFDLDDTLIDWSTAEPWDHYQARRLALLRNFIHSNLHPLEQTDEAMFFTVYVEALRRAWEESRITLNAPSTRNVLAKVLTECGVPEGSVDLDQVLEAYDWQPPEGLRAFPDVIEVLPDLQAHDVQLGIVTNASHPMQFRDHELRAVGLFDLFPRCRLSSGDFGLLKPHRAIFEKALDQVGARPEEAVFVGDNLHADIRGAQGVGMKAVWRKPAAAGDELDEDVIPDGTIHTLHDLLPLLDEWYPGWRNGHDSA